MFNHRYLKLAQPILRGVTLVVTLSVLNGCSLFESDEVVQAAEVPEFANQFQAEILWDKQVGDGVDKYYSRLRPALSDDKLFVADRYGEVFALDPQTGETLWSQDLSELESNNKFDNNSSTARLSGGITADYKNIYIGTENADLIALDALTGELVWQVKTPGEVVSAPLVDSGKVVVSCATGEVVAFNTVDGQQAWQQNFSVPLLSLRSQSDLVSASGAVIYARADGKMSLLLLNSGQLVREHKITTPKGSTEIARLADVDSTPVILAGTIYVVGFNGELHAIDLQSGKPVWKRGYSSFQNLSVSGYDIFVSDAKSHIYSIDRREGQERWFNKLLEWRNVTAPAIAGQHLLVGDEEGYLYWLDRDSGQFVSKLELDDDGLYIEPLVTRGYIFIQTRSGKLIAMSRDYNKE